ncbi:Serine/threonine protein kinase with TPR repeats [Candidatus Sulfopaludibacter sp. SbA6]|nr:Serine/threonine protein kinase with TPR repeats [Candidatus Sulfopaludibacter sp. SbA6]
MALSAGARLGPYEILAPIGAGGMGEVYRARDSRLSREVAIKVLPGHLSADPQALSRFEREAKAVAALSHPNLLVLYDVGTHEGITYAVTELLEGETLREYLSRSSLPWGKAAEMGSAIAEGLAAAHARGIVHRDLKPANIFLTSDGRVKILDFGLATRRPADSENHARADDETQTLAGMVMGTVGYMSPEQVRGEKAEETSDIFSLGCVLYEMVAGRRAFSGKSAGDTMAAILQAEPPAIAESGKQVPLEMERVIGRCLAKNPGERFHSARDLAFALRSIGSGVAELRPAAPPARLRLRTAVAAIAFLAILAGAGWFFWRNHAGQSIDSLAVLPFVNAGGSSDTEYLSDGIAESLMNSLAELPNLKVMSRNAVFRYKGKEADARAVGRELGVRAVLQGRVTERGDNLSISAELVDVEDNSHLWGERYNRKLADAQAVESEIAAQISDKLRLKLSSGQKTRLAKRQTENSEAYQLYLKGRFYADKSTPEGIAKGLDYFHQAVALDPNYALAYSGICGILALMDDVAVAPREVMPKAKEAALKAVELDDTLAEGHAELGSVLFQYDYDWPAAERELRRAVELNPNNARAQEYLGWFLVLIGRFEEGLDHNRRSVALDPVSFENAVLLGWDLYFAGHYDDAVTETRKAIDLAPESGAGPGILGQIYAQQGRFAEAIAIQQKACEKTGDVWLGLAELAREYALAGRAAEAHKALADLLASAKRQYVSKFGIALAYAGMGDKDQALTQLEQAYQDRSCWLDFLKVDPRFDSLRLEPRFQDLMRRMNFPQ